MGPRDRGSLGRRAERHAFSYLRARGLQPVARNFRSRGGEIDLIMLDHECLAFVEVRCRRSTTFADPLHTVDIHKQRKLVRTAALFLSRHRVHATRTVRFDVVAVDGADAGNIRWVRDAFRPDDAAL